MKRQTLTEPTHHQQPTHTCQLPRSTGGADRPHQQPTAHTPGTPQAETGGGGGSGGGDGGSSSGRSGGNNRNGSTPGSRAGYTRLTPHQWEERLHGLNNMLNPCRVCPRQCMAPREQTTGAGSPSPPTPAALCKGLGQSTLMVSSINLHQGEEPPISGTKGSGTVFLTGCNLRCVFCQNYPISHRGHGQRITTKELAAHLLKLEKRGAHNINLVSPTHYTPQLIESIAMAARQGLTIPIVWNTNGYETVETLRLLEGIVDIYMPDFKYWNEDTGRRLSGVADYRARCSQAIVEMYRQVGNLTLDEKGLAVRGVLVRHLLLPDNLNGTEEVLGFLATHLGKEVYISLMSQYFPAHQAHLHPPLDRRITHREYEEASGLLDSLGLDRGWIQDPP